MAVVKDDKYWEEKFASFIANGGKVVIKDQPKPERNYKKLGYQMIDQNGTHYIAYTEYGKYYTAFKMQMSNIRWNEIEHSNEEEAMKNYHEVVKSCIDRLFN